MAVELLRSKENVETVNIVCSKIFDKPKDGSGVRSGFVANTVWAVISAIKPVVDVSEVVDNVIEACYGRRRGTIICSSDQADNYVYRFGKRTLDLCVATAVSLFLSWAIALIWIAVRLTSSGPAIFAQARVGENGRIFICYKFRTMHSGTRQAATHEISSSAVTPLGSWLRRTKLDELPQVWNVFRGDISFVGPRPCLPVQSELIEERMRRRVYAVKPGITGLAQINDIDMSHPGRLAEWDARYVALRSLWNDIRIMMLTILGRGKGDRTIAN
ncbi:sugar transferase [Sphingosinicella humi]|uniref:Sugar transferase n=2 Tax=Allosphingosinicella humi TaxID=2068657 RepID=A0A2U2J667_9SPHN|nr:sugar transferase [Sphingosinicella humi]